MTPQDVVVVAHRHAKRVWDRLSPEGRVQMASVLEELEFHAERLGPVMLRPEYVSIVREIISDFEKDVS